MNILVNKLEEIYIYESPDGGKTVYRRVSGKLERELHYEDPEHKKQQEITNRWVKLKEAVAMATTDTTINDAIEKVELLYALKKKEN